MCNPGDILTVTVWARFVHWNGLHRIEPGLNHTKCTGICISEPKQLYTETKRCIVLSIVKIHKLYNHLKKLKQRNIACYQIFCMYINLDSLCRFCNTHTLTLALFSNIVYSKSLSTFVLHKQCAVHIHIILYFILFRKKRKEWEVEKWKWKMTQKNQKLGD